MLCDQTTLDLKAVGVLNFSLGANHTLWPQGRARAGTDHSCDVILGDFPIAFEPFVLPWIVFVFKSEILAFPNVFSMFVFGEFACVQLTQFSNSIWCVAGDGHTAISRIAHVVSTSGDKKKKISLLPFVMFLYFEVD